MAKHTSALPRASATKEFPSFRSPQVEGLAQGAKVNQGREAENRFLPGWWLLPGLACGAVLWFFIVTALLFLLGA
jgi:hypothetical protein